MTRAKLWSAIILSLAVTGCASSSTPNVTGSGSQLEARQIQTREYDSLDLQMTMRSVLAALQDLGFTIDTADLNVGTITATRLHHQDKYENYIMRMTVTVRQKESGKMAVRANARLDQSAVSNPKTYQDFFSALDKAIFLTLHGVD